MLGNPDLIGIDIGQYAIKIARLKKSGKSFVSNFLGYEIVPSTVRESKDRQALKDFISQILKSKIYKLTKGQPVIHVNVGDTIMRNVMVPEDVSAEGLEGAIELDLSPALPFSIDQVYFDFENQPGKDGSYLTIASRRDIVDAKTALFANKAKTLLTPQVDVDVFAYERLVENLIQAGEVSGSTVAILDIGYNRSRLFVYQNGQYVFAREPQIGGNQATEVIRDIYDIDMETAETRKLNKAFGAEYNDSVLTPYSHSLAEQINLAIDFYEASSAEATKLDSIYLTGGGSQLQDLVPALKTLLTVPTELLSLSSHIKLQSGQSELLQSGLNHGLAIGLAMEGK
ncbi:type IV pilus assembly protein PilM [Suttonella ornithocola]|uniref:Type IV pilus assembly protein PilM n=1 Tax=Suttonella ornithocola TaxID=279832 RepID=A0A380MYC3_9GAMM|nr:type IV pilus assembly protein PilM [Suttonella ornithocola]SUO97302.1 type IV pilus assembly protein PilM [Suttonella ornithocola]